MILIIIKNKNPALWVWGATQGRPGEGRTLLLQVSMNLTNLMRFWMEIECM
ncbi:hypothetical protein HanLR1_Chr10g0368641 [Helianthus annuus]|nr:hypothetical protein HanHA89_Chr10g0391241 [Helianthus annuus]KAJ0697413.1 hypothetical protein HanLR1_Chr10g0368641 [Helianthus annuus]